MKNNKAKEKRCPIRDEKCIAERCMFWINLNQKYNKETQKMEKALNEGYCEIPVRTSAD